MNPSHVACILDGNGRWAQARGMVRSAGHSHGADAARRIVEAADDMGLEWLSMYVFSTENWARPAPEIAVIMRAIERFIDVNLESWHRRGWHPLPGAAAQADAAVLAVRDGPLSPR